MNAYSRNQTIKSQVAAFLFVAFLSTWGAGLAVAATSAPPLPGSGTFAEDLIDQLSVMKSVYRAEYAPADWKKKTFGYDLSTEYRKAVDAIHARPDVNLQGSREVLKNFIYAMRDYHTSIAFTSSESASLPIAIRSTDRHVYIMWINRDKLSESAFPFHEGDELVTFDGKPAIQALQEVQAEIPANVPETDRAVAEVRFTERSASRGYVIPKGPVTLGIRPQGAKTATQIQLIWEYKPEKVSARNSEPSTAATPAQVYEQGSLASSGLLHPRMNVELGTSTSSGATIPAGPDAKAPAENPYAIGNRKSFLPALGTQVWQSSDKDNFDAYIYQAPDRRLIGYIRIASYEAPDSTKAVAEFASVIKRFEASTDVLVIDEMNNPGGSVFYLYALASMLSDQPLKTPQHKVAITQVDVEQALAMIQKLKDVKNDDDAKKQLDPADTDGYPPTYEFARFQLANARFIVSEWNAGRFLSNPSWIGGVDQINPAETHYTKPILLLTNHLDFSGGDFFPTIMQDNKRVTILGTRTAGAGGVVVDVHVPDNVGVDTFRCTESIAWRVDGNPIENLGVKPDLQVEMTDEDFAKHYAPFVASVQNAVGSLVK